MSKGPRRRPVAAAALAVLMAPGLVALGPAGPAQALVQLCAEAEYDDGAAIGTEEIEDAQAASAPLAALEVAGVRRALDRQGVRVRPTTVAVLDGGISDQAEDRVGPVTRLPWSGTQVDPGDGGSVYADPQGTTVAGLLAAASRDPGEESVEAVDAAGGAVGVAPEVELLDVRVYDTRGAGADGASPLTSASVADGLERVAAFPGPVPVVVVPVEVPPSEELRRAVDRVTRVKGAVVVASAGTRAQPEDGALGSVGDDLAQGAEVGEDVATTVYPAGYATDNEQVLAVTTTVPDGADPAETILLSSAVDVAAPSSDAVSVGRDGSYCLVGEAMPAWATAEVAGVLVLLRAAFPTAEPTDLLARLEETAVGGLDPETPPSGAPSQSPGAATRDRYVGRGVVAPLAALERPGRLGQDAGAPDERAALGPAALPAPEQDLLAGEREDALWWALVAGGALLVAVLLRPVLARRRG